MRWMEKLRLRYRSLFRRGRVERELDSELQFHLEQQTAENLTAGMSAQEARYAARRSVGGVEQIKEECRDTRGVTLVRDLVQDLRHGWYVLRRSPAFTAVVVLSLALGIGANTAVFSLMDDLLLRKVNLADPDSLVSLYRIQAEGGTRSMFSIPQFEQMRSHNHVFSGVVALTAENMGISAQGGPTELMPGGFYSGHYFSLLGVQPLLGRLLEPLDDEPGKPLVTVITYQCWKTRFSGDPAVVGKTIRAKGILATIVGVTLPGYKGVRFAPPDFAFPLTWLPQFLLNDNTPDVELIARLKPAVEIPQARAAMNVLFSQILREEHDPTLSSERRAQLLAQSLDVRPAGRGDYDAWEDYRSRIAILIAVVVSILLICCANVANLLLTRAAARHKEMAIRLSIGAGRARLIRQLLTESMLLGAMGGTAGIVCAIWLREALHKLFGFGGTFTLDWYVLTFVAVMGLITSVLFGVAPALRCTQVDLSSGLKERAEGIAATSARGRFPLSKSLVSLQVALSLMLMIGAGLLVRTLNTLSNRDPGFDPHNVLLFGVYPTAVGYEGERETHLYEELLRRFHQIPEVVEASMARHELMQGGYHPALATAAGSTTAPARVAVNIVAPEFFATMRIAFLTGRDFSPGDTPTKVAVVDRKFALNHFGNENPLGKRILLDSIPGQQIEIVGVVKESRYQSLRDRSDVPAEQVFLPFQQVPRDMLGQMMFALRTAGDPASVMKAAQRELQAVDNNLPVGRAGDQSAEVQDSIRDERSLAMLLGLCGGLAVLLACVGLYGVMSYNVARRTGEIGIRMALGAQRSAVLSLVLGEGMLLVLIGIVLGIPGALLATRLLGSVLFGVGASDPATYLSAAALLAAVAALAVWSPARRAVRVDPMSALRNE